MKEWSLCLHGHFYQPPRENAWIEEIEMQESAAPFHDWNKRIHYECYLPNVKARILDKRGLIVDIVNNFEMMNFNFGPTLLAWLEKEHPETYERILEADRKSRAKHNGHGNAMAQVYNHMIMPLANRRDKVTQITWGISDFQFRFGRNAESVWLPETACDEETLEVLVEQGVRFIILAPHQAEAVSPLGDREAWRDVSDGSIDPKVPYRCFLKSDPGKYIDVFFYDGPVTKDVGFSDLAFDAKRFMDRLEGAASGANEGLVSVATDGETFGHHKPFGDRVLAYLLAVEAPGRGVRLVNFGGYLAETPPRAQVRLKEGEDGEGTSWSCVHGVKRWKDDCGCRGGGPQEWTQQWRRPLREALDHLRDQAAQIYEEAGGEYLKDVWRARNDYIEVIFDRTPEAVQRFLERHGKRRLSPEETIRCLKLLEMQRFAMLMYTSCGWFFTEISGIETVQILQYAARAIQLAEELSQRSLEEDFLQRLALAKSNVPEYKDGRGAYERLVKPSVTSLAKIAAHYGILSLFEDHGVIFGMNGFKLETVYRRQESHGNLSINFGRVKVASTVTLEERDLVFLVLEFGVFDFRCSVKPFSDLEDFKTMERELFDGLYREHVVEILRQADEFFGKSYYALKDLLLKERIRVISILTRESIEKISEGYDRLFEENRRMSEIYRLINLAIPQELRYAAEHALNKRLNRAIDELPGTGFDETRALAASRVMEMAKSFKVTLKKDHAAFVLGRELAFRTRDLAENPDRTRIRECFAILEVARKIGVDLDRRTPQDDLFFLLKHWTAEPAVLGGLSEDCVVRVLELAAALGINPEEFRKRWQKLVQKSYGERRAS